jgi:hypothetical protein
VLDEVSSELPEGNFESVRSGCEGEVGGGRWEVGGGSWEGGGGRLSRATWKGEGHANGSATPGCDDVLQAGSAVAEGGKRGLGVLVESA